jgi:hypothetical protein
MGGSALIIGIPSILSSLDVERLERFVHARRQVYKRHNALNKYGSGA